MPNLPELPWQLSVNQTSGKWRSLPGNYDVTHQTLVYPSTNPWGIPDLAATSFVPQRLVRYRAKAQPTPSQGSAWHGYSDDPVLEPLFRYPRRTLPAVRRLGGILTPDYSIFLTSPLAVIGFQCYRKAWLGAWWQAAGCQVIPSVRWAAADSWGPCFAGLPVHSTLAVSLLGLGPGGPGADEYRAAFHAGLAEMVERLAPRTILFYGAQSLCPKIAGVQCLWYPQSGMRPDMGGLQTEGGG